MSNLVSLDTRRAQRSSAELKVVVRFCAGYECQEKVVSHRVRQNINEQREYCSLTCYSRWSPAMRDVIKKYPEYAQTPAGLESLIRDLRQELGITGAASKLGYSRSTVNYWLRKLSYYRQFPGQHPEGILEILSDLAEEDGVECAARLIKVDPKTLKQSLDRFHDRRKAEAA